MTLITRGYGLSGSAITDGIGGAIQTLEGTVPFIDKQDVFEIIRDKIAIILAVETASQQALATAAGKDSSLWKFRVFSERINPWEAFTEEDKSPIVNIWYSNSTYDMAESNVSTRQKATSRYNIDIYAYAESKETAEGHSSGDELAAKLAQHTAKLVRNILIHDNYRYLDMRGTVWRRWPASITMFQPTSGEQAIQRVVGARFELDVEHNETIELASEQTIELINVKFFHKPDGQVIAELEFGEES